MAINAIITALSLEGGVQKSQGDAEQYGNLLKTVNDSRTYIMNMSLDILMDLADAV